MIFPHCSDDELLFRMTRIMVYSYSKRILYGGVQPINNQKNSMLRPVVAGLTYTVPYGSGLLF